MGKSENELISLGFQQNRGTNWTRKHETVQIVRSTEHPKVRVMWREYWKDFLAIIFDYSEIDGPICIVPTQEFFNWPFVSQKRKERSYVNSGYHWSQLFETDHPLARLILKYENRWDILGGKTDNIIIGWPAISRTTVKPSVKKTMDRTTVSTAEERETEFGGMLNAFSDKNLLGLYCDLMEELRKRNIIRSSNNPISDYGEKIVAEKLNLKLSGGSNKGYDAIDQKTGVRYQIKSRRITKHNSSKQLGVIRNLNQKLFDYLVAVIFNESLIPQEIWQIPFDLIPKYSKFSEHQNGHILILSGDILNDKNIKTIL